MCLPELAPNPILAHFIVHLPENMHTFPKTFCIGGLPHSNNKSLILKSFALSTTVGFPVGMPKTVAAAQGPRREGDEGYRPFGESETSRTASSGKFKMHVGKQHRMC